MSTRIAKIYNSRNEEVGAVSFDSSERGWCIMARNPSNCRSGFETEKAAFDFWHCHFDSETGELRVA